MFDINNKDLIRKIIDTKTSDQFVIPLYIKIYNNTYSVLEMDDISEYNHHAFKIGFGACTSLFNYNPYIPKYLIEFSNRNMFNVYDEEQMISIQYYTFESDYINDETSELHKQINFYVDMIEKHIADIVKKKKRLIIDKMIKEGSIE